MCQDPLEISIEDYSYFSIQQTLCNSPRFEDLISLKTSNRQYIDFNTAYIDKSNCVVPDGNIRWFRELWRRGRGGAASAARTCASRATADRTHLRARTRLHTHCKSHTLNRLFYCGFWFQFFVPYHLFNCQIVTSSQFKMQVNMSWLCYWLYLAM